MSLPRNCTRSRVGPRRTCKWYPWVEQESSQLQRNHLKPGDRVRIYRRGECEVAAAPQYQGKTATVIQLCSCGWADTPQEGVWIRVDESENVGNLNHLTRVHWTMLDKLSILERMIE